VSIEVWGDEAGNDDFEKTGSKFFIVATIVTSDATLANDLLALRRVLTLQGHPLHEGFHASEDRQEVRNQVFGLLAQKAIRFDATIYTKSNVYENIKKNPAYFYKWAWFYHLRYILPRVVPKDATPFIGMATLGTRKRRALLAEAMRDVVTQCLPGRRIIPAYWSSASHPCLQAADYYTWAVGRLYEGGDPRAYDTVKHQAGRVHTLL
jgi:hypothetical protein